MELLIPFIILILGCYLIIKGADFLVRGSSSLAKLLLVSEIVIGLTVVAFGTSLPELIVNIFSSLTNHSEISFGNIIGSNIFNILIILGISGLIRPLIIQTSSLLGNFLLSISAPLLLFALANDSWIFGSANNGLSRFDGLVLLVFFAVYLFYTFRLSKKESLSDNSNVEIYTYSKTLLYIIIGFFCLFIGGKWVVDSSVIIARGLGVSEKLIALTIISGGTSFPELATSAVAAYKKRFDLAIGNIIGSNIFNIFFILGISAVINFQLYDVAFNIDMVVLILSTFFLFIAALLNKIPKLNRVEAFVFLLAYIGYLAYLLVRR